MLLYQSNRLEILLERFLALVAQAPADPMMPEIVLVANQGMGQWLQQNIALRLGISANLRFPLVERFLWDLRHNLAGRHSGPDLFLPPVLRWRIAALLPTYLADPLFQELAIYLANDPKGIRRYQLSGRISTVFEQYMIYRPDLLQVWAGQAEAEHWQIRLWQGLLASSPQRSSSPSPLPARACLGASLKALLPALSEQDVAEKLPARVHLFAISALPPQYLEAIALLGKRIEAHFFQLAPCCPQQNGAVRGPQKNPHDTAHPLLASLGQAAQDFLCQLMEHAPVVHDLCANNPAPHLLACLHNDILQARDRRTKKIPDRERYLLPDNDFSLRFHIAFSPLREVQVLHDRLLDLFQRIKGLKPSEVLVCAPDIRHYAAAIAGVFSAPGKSGSDPLIPWTIADQAPEQQHPLIRSFLDLLSLLGKRCTAAEVLGLCENAALLRRFDMDAAFIPRLYDWVEQTGIRWGLDEVHCREHGSRASEQHTWRFGLDRLLLAYLMGPITQPFASRQAASCLLGSEVTQLGGFCSLIDALSRWQGFFRKNHAISSWREALLHLLDDFFAPEDAEENSLEIISRAINDLEQHCRQAGYHGAISPFILITSLGEALARRNKSQLFASDRVQFCNMATMRSIPFRVICLLGMNYQDFPRSQPAPSFDAAAAHPRPGDYDRRTDDCALFLAMILSARDSLHISWVGRSQHDDKELPPSILVSELRDYLQQSYTHPGSSEKSSADPFTTLHPMQPFSPLAYNGTAATASYNPAWLPASAKHVPLPFLAHPLPEEPSQQIPLARLLRFWRHPVRFFLEQGLDVQARETTLSAQESEPFSLDGKEGFFLRQDTVQALLAGQSAAEIQKLMIASARLPQGILGELCFAQQSTHCQGYADILRQLLANPLPPLAVHRQIDSWWLDGQIHQRGQQGRVVWRPSPVKASDLMEAWIQHLLLCLLQPDDMPASTFYLAPKNSGKEAPVLQHFSPLPPDQAEALLIPVLTCFCQGQREALPFFPRTSLVWAKAVLEGEGKEMDKARTCWEGDPGNAQNIQIPPENDELAYRSLYAQRDPLDMDFARISAILLPLLEHMSKNSPDAPNKE